MLFIHSICRVNDYYKKTFDRRTYIYGNNKKKDFTTYKMGKRRSVALAALHSVAATCKLCVKWHFYARQQELL